MYVRSCKVLNELGLIVILVPNYKERQCPNDTAVTTCHFYNFPGWKDIILIQNSVSVQRLWWFFFCFISFVGSERTIEGRYMLFKILSFIIPKLSYRQFY